MALRERLNGDGWSQSAGHRCVGTASSGVFELSVAGNVRNGFHHCQTIAFYSRMEVFCR